MLPDSITSEDRTVETKHETSLHTRSTVCIHAITTFTQLIEETTINHSYTYKYLRSHLFQTFIHELAFYSSFIHSFKLTRQPFIHIHINSTHTLFHSKLHSYYWKLIRCPINHSTSGRRSVQGRDRKWSAVAFGSVNPIHCAFPPLGHLQKIIPVSFQSPPQFFYSAPRWASDQKYQS